MGGMGLIFTPVLVRCVLGPLGLSGLMTGLPGLMDIPNGPIERFNPSPAAYLPTPPTPPLLPASLLYM